MEWDVLALHSITSHVYLGMQFGTTFLSRCLYSDDSEHYLAAAKVYAEGDGWGTLYRMVADSG